MGSKTVAIRNVVENPFLSAVPRGMHDNTACIFTFNDTTTVGPGPGTIISR